MGQDFKAYISAMADVPEDVRRRAYEAYAHARTFGCAEPRVKVFGPDAPEIDMLWPAELADDPKFDDYHADHPAAVCVAVCADHTAVQYRVGMYVVEEALPPDFPVADSLALARGAEDVLKGPPADEKT